MDVEQYETILQGISRTCQGIRLYPVEHPAVMRQLDSLLDALEPCFSQGVPVRFGIADDILFCNEELYTYPIQPEAEVRRFLEGVKITGLELHPGLSGEDLAGLFRLVRAGSLSGPTFTRTLKGEGVTHITLLGGGGEDETPEVPEETVEQVDPDAPIDFSEPVRVHNRALEVVDNIFKDIRLGKIPAVEGAKEVVKQMAAMTIAEPSALFALSMIKDYDDYTFTHSVNVSVIALTVGRACGLSQEDLRKLGLGALLHDIGKLKVDINIINKPGKLSPTEFEAIKQHPREGAELVEHMSGVDQDIRDMVYGHHRHFNQQGYPKAEQSTLSPLVDMVTIADIYDAITTLRPYQRPMTPRQALNRMREMVGTILNPEVFDRYEHALGPFPVGSLVRLDSNEIALVRKVDPAGRGDIQLLLLFDAAGVRLEKPREIRIPVAEQERMIADVDPFLKGVDVCSYFS